MSKIISIFLFARSYERQVLLAKLHSEYEFVTEFIGIESSYDTHGNYKGVFLEEVLKGEEFKPFLDKITVLSNPDNFYPAGAAYDEQNNLLAEFNSRAYCWPYIQNKYQDDDWLLLEDCDELLDFSNPQRRDILLDIFKKESGSIQIKQDRFWWDFDNFSLYEKYEPCHQVGKLKEMDHPFHHRNRNCKTVHTPIICAFEYSHCFSQDENWIKVTTSAHDKYQESTMESAYLFNCFHREPRRSERLSYPLDFFETIELTPENSPKFVLDNIDRLRVDTIDPAYSMNRKISLNCHPHPIMQHNLLRGNKIRDDRNYYKR